MKLYIYNRESMEVVAIINGETNDECESKAEAAGYSSSDDIGRTYSPAFGLVGLLDSEEAKEI